MSVNITISICMILFRKRWIRWACHQINKQLLFLQESAPDLNVEVLMDTPYPELVRTNSRNVTVYDSRLQDIGSKRNTLVRKARGPLICMMDDDNWYAEYFVACCLKALQEPRAQLVIPKDILCMDLKSYKIFKLSHALCEGALLATRSFLSENKFKTRTTVGEGSHLLDLDQDAILVDGLHAILIDHGSNVCCREVPTGAKPNGIKYFDPLEIQLLPRCGRSGH